MSHQVIAGREIRIHTLWTSLLLAAMLCFLPATASAIPVFNGTADYQVDSYNYFYRITGGLFPTGTTPNGDNASGGTFRYITDDPAWGSSIDVWHKDDWFSDNAGFALTLWNGASRVYDNNGLETGGYGDYYDAHGSHGLDGLYRGYSMSNNYDWVYASYFEITAPTTITAITGYFDGNGLAGQAAFDPSNPDLKYRTNIWSNVAGDLLPTNTGSFSGDVFSSDITYGVSGISDTGVFRILPDNSTDPIYRLTYTLDQAITLQPGVYWFEQDATVPEPGTLLLVGAGVGWLIRLRKRLA